VEVGDLPDQCTGHTRDLILGIRKHIRCRGLEHVHLVRTARGSSRFGSSAIHSFSDSEKTISPFPAGPGVGPGPGPRPRLWDPVGGCVYAV
jgi:hypothetical protein